MHRFASVWHARLDRDTGQAPAFDEVLAELKVGAKRTHWMWFVFPQLRGLGRTSTAQFYGIQSSVDALRIGGMPCWARA